MLRFALSAVVLCLAGKARAAGLDLTPATGAGRPVADVIVTVRPDAGVQDAARPSGSFPVARNSEPKLYGRDETRRVILPTTGYLSLGWTGDLKSSWLRRGGY
jgi:hypothetical protein